jgi:large subunit ribosomal protein L15
MTLNTLKRQKNFSKPKKIVGRGAGSGKGFHTVGRGMNGQRSRSGGNKNPRIDFAGGQNPLSRQLPKLRGFKPLSTSVLVYNIKLSDLNVFKDGETISVENLVKSGLLKLKSSPRKFRVKILSKGELSSKNLVFEGVVASESAKQILLSNGAIFGE